MIDFLVVKTPSGNSMVGDFSFNFIQALIVLLYLLESGGRPFQRSIRGYFNMTTCTLDLKYESIINKSIYTTTNTLTKDVSLL